MIYSYQVLEAIRLQLIATGVDTHRLDSLSSAARATCSGPVCSQRALSLSLKVSEKSALKVKVDQCHGLRCDLHLKYNFHVIGVFLK